MVAVAGCMVVVAVVGRRCNREGVEEGEEKGQVKRSASWWKRELCDGNEEGREQGQEARRRR